MKGRPLRAPGRAGLQCGCGQGGQAGGGARESKQRLTGARGIICGDPARAVGDCPVNSPDPPTGDVLELSCQRQAKQKPSLREISLPPTNASIGWGSVLDPAPAATLKERSWASRNEWLCLPPLVRVSRSHGRRARTRSRPFRELAIPLGSARVTLNTPPPRWYTVQLTLDYRVSQPPRQERRDEGP